VTLRGVRDRGNASLHFSQSPIHSEYLFYLYSFFESFCISSPKIRTVYVSSTGKSYPQLRFGTRALGLFNEFHTMFYTEKNKTVPANIGEFLTVRSLAFWSMDDGCLHSTGYGFYLCTHSFTKDEVLLLCSVLQDKFGLVSSIHLERGKPKIDIKARSLNSFRSLVRPYFHESMLYKLEKTSKE
jgi:hypothetical protein